MKNKTRDSSKDFNIGINEYTKTEGTYAITYRQPDSENNNKLSVGLGVADGQTGDSSGTGHLALLLDTGQRREETRPQEGQPDRCLPLRALLLLGTVRQEGGDRGEPCSSYFQYRIQACQYDHITNYQVYITRLGLNDLVRDHSAYVSCWPVCRSPSPPLGNHPQP